MAISIRKSFPPFVAMLLFSGAHCVAEPANSSPYPKPTDGFKPMVTYATDLASSWKAVISAITENQIPIESASKDANQITTGYRKGPSDGGLGGGFFGGKLVTQYKYSVFFIPVSSSQTQIKVSAVLEARRNAASLGKILSGNNAVSDTRWIDATADNPAVVEAMQNWLYEQIEQKIALSVPSANTPSAAVSPTSGPCAAASTAAQIKEQLEKIDELRRNRAITDAEYKGMRAKVLCL